MAGANVGCFVVEVRMWLEHLRESRSGGVPLYRKSLTSIDDVEPSNALFQLNHLHNEQCLDDDSIASALRDEAGTPQADPRAFPWVCEEIQFNMDASRKQRASGM